MSDGSIDLKAEARARALSVPQDEINVRDDQPHWPYFELQLRVIWEEIIRRFPVIELTGEPSRIASSFIHGYDDLPVVIPHRT